jgi:hypothetical protein
VWDGHGAVWSSRANRRHHGRRRLFWPPRGVDWFMAMGFAVGSLCFALGAIPGYARLVGPGPDAVTYFVGSIFFTTAGYLTFFECINAGRAKGERRRFGAVQPGRIDWWATAIQFLGTLFFNISTFDATRTGLSAHGSNVYVWAPDVLGSICFLVSSELAFAEAGHSWLSWRPRDLGWTIAALNLLGSVFFGISAIGAYVIPQTDELLNEVAANAGTFLGAVCFLIGALLLLPESAQEPPATPAPA